MKKLGVVAIAATTLVIGAGIGASNNSSKASVKPITHTVMHTVYKTKTVYRTPQACVTAMTRLNSATRTETNGALAIIKGASVMDVGQINAGTALVNKATGIEKSAYAPVAECMAHVN